MGWVVVQPIPLSLPTRVEVELGCDKSFELILAWLVFVESYGIFNVDLVYNTSTEELIG